MAGSTTRYRPAEVEGKARELWDRLDVFKTPEPPKKPFFCLDMFPYPSGEGLHVGHVEGYTATDIYSRYKRMRGFDVLHPMGWDAFGLPAENMAIKTKVHPRTLVAKNVAYFKKQLQRMGYSYDWSKEINTTDPDYYRWTQWIFLKLFHLGLAYEAEVPINWCPSDKTGLANEEVIDGKCERCGTPVEKKNIRQWILRITKYADRLLRDLDDLDWPEGIKELQRNWIGRSEGTEILFKAVGGRQEAVGDIAVFTTRADTLFGATYLVLAPEHPLVERIVVPERRDEVLQYSVASRNKSDVERTAIEKEKTGVDTGAKAINPVNGEEIPIWVADYVLATYGTGAIMAVPAHDERDFAFAQKYGLEIREVIRGNGDQGSGNSSAFIEDGVLVNSGEFTGRSSGEAREKITVWLEEHGYGKRTTRYKLRDWLFSRQRYWGEPIPIIHCASCGIVPVPEDQLPVLLPDVEHYEPTGTGESPLAGIESWVNTSCPNCGKVAKRETNTMPQWAGSCWYFLRFASPVDRGEGTGDREYAMPWTWEDIERWLPVHLYVGGAEHAVLHLLYARFWVKALYDGGYLPIQEPFASLRNQGLILGPDGQKMSKSRGNVVNPDEIVEKYGADTLRLYEMFLGPLEAAKPWNPGAINGVHRFLYRVWEIGTGHSYQSDWCQTDRGTGDRETTDVVRRSLHRLIKKVGDDIEQLKFNTAIAAMMEFVNLVEKESLSREEIRAFILVLSPFAPHIAEALWMMTKEQGTAISLTGVRLIGEQKTSITQEQWPVYDASLLEETDVTIVVQVNGKVRGELRLPKETPADAVQSQAEALSGVRTYLEGKTVQRVIVVPGKLLNFVVTD